MPAFGAEPGSIGPVGAGTRVIADEALREGQYVGGANRTGYHLLGVEAGRDFQAEFADIREVSDGEACPQCGGTLRIERVIEIGNIFKLGTKYSVPLDATFLDESGKEHPIVMGSYGIGLARDHGRGDRTGARRAGHDLAAGDRTLPRAHGRDRRRGRRAGLDRREDRRRAVGSGSSTCCSTTATRARA